MIKKHNTSQVHNIYEILDHIVTPSESYVDTGITADETVVVEFVITNNQYDTSRSGRFFSTYDNDWWGSSGTWSCEFESRYIGMIGLGRYGYYTSSISANDVNGRKLRFNVTATGYLNIYDMNDILQYSWDIAAHSTSYSSSSNITLLGVLRENGDGWSLCDGTEVYSFKIWKNNTLVRDYIPVKRLSDDAIGLYDTINETFNENDVVAGYSFTGVSKATPEYISENNEYNVNINSIKAGSSNICRIYNKGNLYFGTMPEHQPQENYICGYTDQANITINSCFTLDGHTYNLTSDENKYFKVDLEQPVEIFNADDFWQAGTSELSINYIEVIDFTHVKWNLTKLFPISNTKYGMGKLTDVYFDFRNVDLTNINGFGINARFVQNNFQTHGLGTINVTFPEAQNNEQPNDWCLREGTLNGTWTGTLDIRGIDTHNVIDWPRNVTYPADSVYGAFYNWPGSYNRCTTLIIGNLEWPYDRCRGWNYFKTLYCTAQTPPSLNRTGTYGITAKNYLSAMSRLSNIYVPTGCLSVYQTAPVWSNYANIISEREAPDPMTI